jgi:hypothetical protein
MQSKLTPNVLTDAATIPVDWNVSQNQAVTLGGNRTLTFANGVAGSTYSLSLTQDGTGSRTVTWPSTVKWAGGSAPTLTTTAARTDQITFYFDGTYYRDVAIKKDFNLA